MKNLSIILFVVISFLGFAQRQGNIWYFGDHAGLDFNSGIPIPIVNGQTYSPDGSPIEGSAVISDSSGALLFYSNGMKVWNKNHQVMPNGDSLLSSFSSTQAALVVPQPGSSRYFYVFTTDDFYKNTLKYGFRYSMVDICLDNGFGDVIIGHKNIKLLDTVAEKLTAVRHVNGVDYWIITHKYYSDVFYSFHLSSVGIVDTVISHVGSRHPSIAASQDPGAAIGYLKASPDGSKLAIVNGNSGNHAIAEYFDFDNSTGIVSNWRNIQTDSTSQYYGVSFSPDNSKLYISCWLNNNGVFQFDLTAGGGNMDSVRASKIKIAGQNISHWALQLGIDGKIYIATGGKYLSVIKNPNNVGLNCNYADSVISLYGNSNNQNMGLPNFIDSYNYSNTICNCPLSITTTSISSQCNNQCNGSATVTASGGTGPFSYNWSNGQSAQTAVGLCAGNYVVTVSDVAALTTTAAVTITQPFAIAIAAFVTTNTCSGSSMGRAVVNATGGTPGYAYSWSNGQVTQTASGLSAGLHTVTVTDAIGCVGTDSVTVSVFLPPTVTITGNTTVCSGQNIALTASGGQTYIWNTGNTTNLLTQPVFANSAYSVTVTDVNGCSATGTAAVTANPVPVITVTGGGTIIQGQATQLVASGAGTFLWTPDTGLSCTSCNNPFASPKVKTTYCVLFADSNNCTDTACVTIDINCGEIFIPSVFSPNNDGKNDVEYVRGKCIRSLYFAIYDRWGEKVFETTDQAIGWDGVFSGKPCSNDVYTYYCNITMTDGSVVSRKGTVTLTR